MTIGFYRKQCRQGKHGEALTQEAYRQGDARAAEGRKGQEHDGQSDSMGSECIR